MQYYSGRVAKPDQTKLGSTKPNRYTHKCIVPIEKQVSYRGRKVVVTQNVVCIQFDMIATFVYADWEDTTND